MSSLKLQLFGSPPLVKDGALVKLGRSKAMALFVYLAVTEQVHSRDTLATLFWPESDQNSARADLSRILSVLKKALGEHWLMTDHQTVGLVRSSELWLDVAEFRRHLAACRSHAHPPDIVCPDCFALLREAVTLCQGDFLAGFSLSDCPEFEIWQLFQAEDLHLALAEALQKLTHWYSDKDEPGRAIDHARRWLALDPLHEPAHRALIELYLNTSFRFGKRKDGSCWAGHWLSKGD
jgi:DNA-binding SARP family transcriptional activator